ncbi:exodeoxyribonuclease V subunit alpha [Isoptericola variabilis]|uniref:RecBCD enzyme subunit RecD n=1 Tax=Isoptericola variabilis (strain 225) TaxID=743718 RepID=F6FXA0_ISOV2|nr:exodeoxyribonuclease V subunit alpha [Isoptericola variabilis]AEG43603.1 exodeoxyribonuclease V, alpha subunit [Isoptericola variabilis 225]TWH32029.1 DNA helicase/exodeoxyribonuclease V alpha subunit [Isoptericola variabilis J7]
MSAPTVAVPPASSATTAGDPRLALHAGPLLAEHNRAGIVSAADVHVARRLGRLAGEPDERVLLAVALAVRAVRSGSVCVELDDREALAVPEAEDAAPAGDLRWPEPAEWRAAVEASPLVAVGPDGPADRPARWVDGRLYLDRYWRHEMVVRREVDARLDGLAPDAAGLDVDRAAAAVRRLFPAAGDTRQRLAAATALLARVTVLTGGPGTGKTTTVARLLAVLQDVLGDGGPLRVALAAPTGKAAARLQEAVAEALDGLDAADRERVGSPAATTMHRLLGWRPGSSTRFRHDAGHHLPHDVVVVDETSMVSLPLMARLLEALRPDARLVLVGDPDQLASVEAGAVLGDLVARPPVADALPTALARLVPGDVPGGADGDGEDLRRLRNGVVRLVTVHRQRPDSAILPLATAVREGDADEALRLLRAGGADVEFVEVAGERPDEDEVAALRADAVGCGGALVAAARAGDAGGALRALERHRLLLAHRRGPAGVAHWDRLVEEWVAEAVGDDGGHGAWYAGRPLLVTTNDRDTGLYNGDTGVVVADGRGGLVAAFGKPASPLLVRPHRLPDVETVHAMTVHRGQGSQFDRVTLVLPPATSPLLTRELLYTAVTRARSHVRILGTEDAVRAAVGRPVRRASGLRRPLG